LAALLSTADAEGASEARARARRVGIAAVGIRERMLIPRSLRR
jgi:hypothetical protein